MSPFRGYMSNKIGSTTPCCCWRENAETLTKEINKILGLTPPHVENDVTHAFHQYVMRVEDDYRQDRDKLAEHLKKKGVDVAVHYPTPVYEQPVYDKLGYQERTCPVTEETCKCVLSLPVHPSVTKENIRYILDVLREKTSWSGSNFSSRATVAMRARSGGYLRSKDWSSKRIWVKIAQLFSSRTMNEKMDLRSVL